MGKPTLRWNPGDHLRPAIFQERLPEDRFASDICTYVRFSGTYVPMAVRPTPRSAPTTRGTARDAILTATLRLVASEGVDAVTHRRVAKLAGVSPGSTTHHFSGRDDLLREAFRHYIDAGSHLFDVLFEAAEQDQEVSLRVVRDVFVSLIEREFADPTLVRAEYELLLFASKDDELSGVVASWEGRLAGALAAVLERAGARRPTQAARVLMNFVRGFELERLVKPKIGIGDFRRRLTPLLQALCEGNE